MDQREKGWSSSRLWVLIITKKKGKREKKGEREALESDVRSNINVEKSGLKNEQSLSGTFTSDKISNH